MPANVLTVTLNPTLDVSTSVARLIDHAKLRCTPELEQVGGGGINVAHVIHSLGGSCQAMLPVGGSRGQDILARLAASGLDCVTAAIEQQNRQCFTVYESETGHEYRFVLPGPSLSPAEQDACIAAICEHLPSDYLVLSGSLPPGVPDDFYASIIGAARRIAPELRVVVDTSGAPLKHALGAGVFMIKPSQEEFCALTDQTFSDPLDGVSVCQALIAQVQAQVIALTLGARGALLVTAQDAWRIEPLPVKVTSTVGAGDSFVGGFVWSLTQNPDWIRAAQIGTAAATAALQTQGELRFDSHAILKASQDVVILPC
ncbi:1-phosphofructokinase family hexose kinase [Orrella daihaiensis]|uniref:Phosphofructokinase n=1 Tax=Orrella daihaiensis TaxID=2782176 RepID=A0ABY4AQH7_9BURK|nr:1-phosphofructokinase family hexose kinase [Orrella daihaiensis]UOD51310.1 1-phosphofructokinase family hexose kinase [Orrella daihaiensis]